METPPPPPAPNMGIDPGAKKQGKTTLKALKYKSYAVCLYVQSNLSYRGSLGPRSAHNSENARNSEVETVFPARTHLPIHRCHRRLNFVPFLSICLLLLT